MYEQQRYNMFAITHTLQATYSKLQLILRPVHTLNTGKLLPPKRTLGSDGIRITTWSFTRDIISYLNCTSGILDKGEQWIKL